MIRSARPAESWELTRPGPARGCGDAVCALVLGAVFVLLGAEGLYGQSVANHPAALPAPTTPTTSTAELPKDPTLPTIPVASKWFSPEELPATLQVFLMLSVLSLAPALMLMTTCYVRLTVVLHVLRHALGTAQLPPNQVLTSLAVFLSVLIMTPVWSQVYADGIKPYTQRQLDGEQAWQRGTAPLRNFMSAQIERSGNGKDVELFLAYVPIAGQPQSHADVPLQVLVPAFLLSELKTAFVIGFQIVLPFLIIDLVVASVLTSMGMIMLPPVLVSLPFKLLLFVMADGWHLVVSALLESFVFQG